MLAQGKRVKEVDGGFWVFVPCLNHKEEVKACLDTVTVEFTDGRQISHQQRRKVYVLLKCIADSTGYTPVEAIKATTKYMFQGTGYSVKDDIFSLSNCDMTTARLYISWLIDFCLTWDIPCGEPLYSLCEDMERYVYSSLMNKRCCICQQKAELHHWQAVGMGRNRKEIIHVGMDVLPLCRTHHCEIHKIGRDTFKDKYHIVPIKFTDRMADVYRMTRKQRGDSND